MKKKIATLIILAVLWFALYSNLELLANFLVDDVLKLTSGERFSETLRFFFFEVPKILLLLLLIVFIVGFIQSYFSPEKTRKKLEGKPLFLGNVMASVLGIVTPFCSCSAVPLFLGFVEAGIPIGVTFSFLIAAPMINEVALVLLIGLFGWKIAAIYVATGLFVAIISGYIIEKLKLQKYVADWVFKAKINARQQEEEKPDFEARINIAFDTVKEVVGKIWIYVILGIAVGAGVHGYIPDEYLSKVLGADNWYSVPLAILVGVPLYSNAAGVIPIVGALIEKGVTLGTALAFMMSVIGLSLPEVIILKRVLKWQLISAFIGVVAFGILMVGYIFNYIF